MKPRNTREENARLHIWSDLAMPKKSLFISVIAIAATLAISARAHAWGCARVGYHYGGYGGAYHAGYTHYNPYTGNLYHVGTTRYGYGGAYGGGYRYGYGAYGYGGYHYGAYPYYGRTGYYGYHVGW
jgi:hypothetical protein